MPGDLAKIQRFQPPVDTREVDNQAMFLLYFLADAFINFFGITQPTAKARRQAAFFILSLMLVLIGAMVAAGAAVYFVMK